MSANNPQPASRPLRWIKSVLRIVIALVVIIAGAAWWMTAMPGESRREAPAEPTPAELALAVLHERDVRMLAETIGERHVGRPRALHAAERYVAARLADSGCAVQTQEFLSGQVPVRNLELELPGTSRPEEIVIVGAHYDSAYGTPGADDNASGVAALLALAAEFCPRQQARTLRLVAFVNEELFQQPEMGSLRYARAADERGERIVAMISLEMLGYFSDAEGSQRYPGPLRALYPTRGDFIAFVSNLGNRALVRRTLRTFRREARITSEGGALPGNLPGVSWSDHWAFWQFDYPALMITDTALFRNPNYHRPSDRPPTLDYRRMARVTHGLIGTIVELTAEN